MGHLVLAETQAHQDSQGLQDQKVALVDLEHLVHLVSQVQEGNLD